MGIKKKDFENLSKENIQHVISLLEKGTSKKEACQILNISYNTTRLKKIIEGFKESLAHEESMREKMKNKSLDESDIKYIITRYLQGDSYTDIADSLYRSSYLVKKVLQNNNIPLRSPGTSYFKPQLLPENSIKEDYNDGDLVYSARYDVPALIKRLQKNTETHGKVYLIWLLGDWNEYSYQPYYELADLTKIQAYYNG